MSQADCEGLLRQILPMPGRPEPAVREEASEPEAPVRKPRTLRRVKDGKGEGATPGRSAKKPR
jgi:hypothetical protein